MSWKGCHRSTFYVCCQGGNHLQLPELFVVKHSNLVHVFMLLTGICTLSGGVLYQDQSYHSNIFLKLSGFHSKLSPVLVVQIVCLMCSEFKQIVKERFREIFG